MKANHETNVRVIKLTKRMKTANEQVTKDIYPLKEAIELAQSLSMEKFTASVDVVFSLGIPKGESVRGALCPDAGTGKSVRVAVFAQGDQAAQAKEADRVGAEDLVEEFKTGKVDFDVLIASPEMMRLVGKLGRVLGPKGLMPNPKLGTVSSDIAQAVSNAKKGQIFYRNDKSGLVHARLGPVSFKADDLLSNIKSLVAELKRVKPVRAKGQYIRSCYISTTMGPGIPVDLNTLD